MNSEKALKLLIILTLCISFTSIDFKKVLPVWTDCKLSPIDFVLHIQRYQQENNWINHRLNYAGIQKLIIQLTILTFQYNSEVTEKPHSRM